jgi:hypothetical protein
MSATPCPPAGEPVPPPPSEMLRDEVSQLHEAVRSQRDIGMAIGLVSARYHCSTEQAWRTLLRVSQDSNTKVRTVAAVLVAAHDGTADADDVEALGRFLDHLPPSGWPARPGTGEDPAP